MRFRDFEKKTPVVAIAVSVNHGSGSSSDGFKNLVAVLTSSLNDFVISLSLRHAQ